ncbi:MAG: hypothetical protein DBX55_01180 [Verrucomicrobia bacterium]|nr:MAG: hypothetical protein DBX55_01180 [Verrucomicrobiota bacterium]
MNMRKRYISIVLFLFLFVPALSAQFKDAASYGFSPEKSAAENVKALQSAVSGGGTILVSKPGTYDLNDSVLLDDNTKLVFGAGVVIRKVAKPRPFNHVFINRGAFEKKWNSNIWIDGLTLSVNGVDSGGKIFGLRGHVAFFYAKDIKITRFRCYDLMNMQYCIHVCTFEDLLVDDAIIYGKKDGIHLGRGKRFKLSNCVFRTFDDAVALNAHDYASGNPELGWIEDGVVENMTDLTEEKTTGYFCRILAGSWCDWREGMEIQNSDTVVCNGRLYRAAMKPDGKKYVSKTPPSHESGMKEYDGIVWQMVQNDVTYNAGVRNVVFRDIFLRKPRTCFSVHFDDDKYSRSYYPGAPFVGQENLVFDNVHVLFDENRPFISTRTPINELVLNSCFLRNNPIRITPLARMKDASKTTIKMLGCTVSPTASYVFLESSKGKPVDFVSVASSNSNPKAELTYKTDQNCSCVNSDFMPNSKLKLD